MWQFARYLVLLALVISGEASPKRYHGLLNKFQNVKTTVEPFSENVYPTNYEIELTVLEENLKNGNFSGKVTINITVIHETESFQIHAKKLTITKATLDETDITSTVHVDDNTDLLEIKADASLTEGDHKLVIEYDGILSDTDMEGLYRSSYKEAGSDEPVYLAATQFEQMGARRAFPCFDQPALKATFNAIVHYSDGYSVYFNTKSKTTKSGDDDGDADVKTITFETTPKMSTYLVAFIISKFNCTTGGKTTDDIVPEACARTEALDTLGLALETAPAALDAMADFTGLAYKELGNPKMTQVAIPDFAAGAMENWGLVTYRETALLNDEKESSNYYKQVVVADVTHEFAHQWFGDYITLDWWSNVFLNEGFATYFEYHAAAKVQPEWELEKQFVVDEVQPVLYTDSTGNTVALSSDPQDSDEIEAKFDDISYNKGGTVIRMLQHFLGLDIFKLGLNKYLAKEPIGYPNELWKSFDEALPEFVVKPSLPIDNATIEEIMKNWTFQPGYPLLDVKTENSNFVITQKQFLPNGANETNTEWYVPITYTTSADTTSDKTDTKEWLIPGSSVTINATELEWIVLNNQQVGYYRVNYPSDLLDKIKKALESDVSSIDEISRSQLVDDQLNLARLGHKSYKEVLEFLTFLENDDSYYSWYPAFTGFDYLLKRTDKDEVKQSITDYITKLMNTKLLASVTKDNTTNQVYTLKQELAQTWACKLSVDTCLTAAEEAFNKLISDEATSVDPNKRSYVYCTALRTSDNASAVYDFLWNKYLGTTLSTEQVTILKALGCTTDTDLRTQYLKEALGENVRLQDVRYVFQSVYTNGGITEIFDFIKNNYTDFTTRFGSTATANNLITTVADYITNDAQKTSLDELDGVSDDEEFKAVLAKAKAQVESNLETIKSLETTLTDYFDNSAGVGINGYHFVNLALAAVVYFLFNLY